ncbi:sensor histidine kinase [Limnoraphis robusta Tam1]|uniref:sensor histidine kinase n=1 Tax=Limnoraphis robusta TaxID=1118279 RepID=UPI002B1F7903|nr:sensor histidine kinase [Limnoraphis robusta]MEA5496671.1 sensor histidine kinase [Limnoraphis robusta BA-68 BA1]MEA5541652.1 sensor histidine kinase [Limnoraphis robusta Tam1]
MQWFRKHNHPFRLLLYLEWILLAIAVLTAFSPFPPPPSAKFSRYPHEHRPPLERQFNPDRNFNPNYRPPRRDFPRRNRRKKPLFPLGFFASIAALGLIGLRLPLNQRSSTIKGLYTALGFGLSWLAVFCGSPGASFLSALLLVVVIRACVLFPWRGRVVVAFFAYLFFLVLMFLRVRPVGIPLINNSLSTASENPIPESWRWVVFSLTLNSALLFGFVLIFVVLLVGTLLSEKQSRQELAQANQRLREYAILAEDRAILQERNRIAREIHDSVGHNLTAQSIQLENAQMWLQTDPEKAEEHLDKARKLGRNALQEVRQSVAKLRSHPLKGQSLETALSKLLQQFQQTTQIQLTSDIYLIHAAATDVEITLYRVIQEALTNISKHSQATKVELSLIEHPLRIELTIEDNGFGFYPEENTTGFGLEGMRERVTALGGLFKLNSQPGQGCKIDVNIPQLRDNHDPNSVS